VHGGVPIAATVGRPACCGCEHARGLGGANLEYLGEHLELARLVFALPLSWDNALEIDVAALTFPRLGRRLLVGDDGLLVRGGFDVDRVGAAPLRDGVCGVKPR